MNNDLISREALKKALSDKDLITYTHEYGDAIPVGLVMSAIDNAPTVEPFEPDYVGAERVKARQRGYEQGYHEGVKTGKTLNPKIKQGEWLDVVCKNGGFFHGTCSVCKIRNDIPPLGMANFCPNCGAKMQKEGAE